MILACFALRFLFGDEILRRVDDIINKNHRAGEKQQQQQQQPRVVKGTEE